MSNPTAPESKSRRRSIQGEQTRQAILQIAVDIASVEGLQGLSIGRLATELGMSKSGLFAHFGSKEELQLETVETAKVIFRHAVVQPTLGAKPGITRLIALCRAWFSYGEGRVFRGGCFFAAATLEFDGRPGAVCDRLIATIQDWLKFLADLIRQAQELGELDITVEPEQLAFELHALFWGANSMLHLDSNSQAIVRAKTAIHHRLTSLTTQHIPEF